MEHESDRRKTKRAFLPFSKVGFNSILTKNLQMFKLDLEKAEEPEVKC